MAQAARKRKRGGKSTQRRSGGSSLGMLVIGLISGSVLAALILGAKENDKYGFGSGLKTLFVQDRPPIRTTATETADPPRPAPKPKLDFYTVLPRIERIISEPEPPPRPEQPRREEQAWYVLQVAAYEKFEEADRLKAQLTLTGFEPKLQKVSIEDKGVYYRVRLGPYKSREELSDAERRLSAQGISGMLLRVTVP